MSRREPELSAEARAVKDAVAAMTDEDWELIGAIVESLRERFPGLHIEYGPW